MLRLIVLALFVVGLSFGDDLKSCLDTTECAEESCKGFERCLWNKCLCITAEEKRADTRPSRLEGPCESDQQCQLACGIRGFSNGRCILSGCSCFTIVTE